LKSFREEALHAISRNLIESSVGDKESRRKIREDCGIRPVHTEPVFNDALAYPHCPWTITAVPDDVYTSKAVQGRMSKI
jgi:hypothetical protein